MFGYMTAHKLPNCIKRKARMNSSLSMKLLSLFTVFVFLTGSPAYAEGDEHGEHDGHDHGAEGGGTPIQWQAGPATASLGDIAEIKVPAKFQFAGREDTQRLMQAMGNPSDGTELGLLTPDNEKANWFIVFEFSDVGYVNDDEKDKLDANGILESIREGTNAANEERKKSGFSAVEVLGWMQPPMYDPKTNYLQWAIKGKSGEEMIINYNMRILGRDGVMSAGLVADPKTIETVLPLFKQLIGGFNFKSGKKYSEYVQGDKIAQYGLSALVAGGAAAVLVKSGLFKKFWKLLVFGLLGVVAIVKKFFGFGKKKTEKTTAETLSSPVPPNV